MALAFYFMISTLPIYVTNILKANNTLAGLILSSYTVTALIIRPFTGIAIDSIGRKLIFIISMFVFALLFNAYILAVTVAIILIIRTLHGIAWGVMSTSGSTLAVDILPASKRGEGIGYYGISMTIGMALGPLLALSIINNLSYNAMFRIGGGICLIGFLLILFIRYPKYNAGSRKFNWKNLIELKAVPLSLNILLIQITYGGLLSFIAIYGKQIGIKNPGLFFLVYAIGIALSRIFSGKIFDRKGPKFIVFIGMILLIIGFPVLSLVQSMTGFLISGFILGIGNGIVIPSFQTMVNNLVDQNNRGAANSTYMTAFDLGIGGGMILIGFLADKITISHAYLICSLFCLLAFLIFFLFTLKHYQNNKLI